MPRSKYVAMKSIRHLQRAFLAASEEDNGIHGTDLNALDISGYQKRVHCKQSPCGLVILQASIRQRRRNAITEPWSSMQVETMIFLNFLGLRGFSSEEACIVPAVIKLATYFSSVCLYLGAEQLPRNLSLGLKMMHTYHDYCPARIKQISLHVSTLSIPSHPPAPASEAGGSAVCVPGRLCVVKTDQSTAQNLQSIPFTELIQRDRFETRGERRGQLGIFRCLCETAAIMDNYLSLFSASRGGKATSIHLTAQKRRATVACHFWRKLCNVQCNGAEKEPDNLAESSCCCTTLRAGM